MITQDVVAVLQLFGIGLLAWILQKLVVLDAKLSSLTTWKEMHDKMDDMRHNEDLKKFDQIFSAIWKAEKGLR